MKTLTIAIVIVMLGSVPANSQTQEPERVEQVTEQLKALRVHFDKETFTAPDGKVLPYRLFKPQNRDSGAKYPLVVYLHGGQGRGTDNIKNVSGGNVYGACVWALGENQSERPCFVLAPQLLTGVSTRRNSEMAVRGERTGDQWKLIMDSSGAGREAALTLRKKDGAWEGYFTMERTTQKMPVSGLSFENGVLRCTVGDFLKFDLNVDGDSCVGTSSRVGGEASGRRVMALIKSIMSEFSIDANRVYVTGQSMGGRGTWSMIALYPDVFAAAVPVCGVGDLESAPDIVKNKIAVWAFHGTDDPLVPVENSRKMVAALKEAGGRPKYTEYPGVKHNSWVNAYLDPELARWLFEQRRNQ